MAARRRTGGYLVVIAIVGTTALLFINLIVLVACLVPTATFCIYGLDMEKMLQDDRMD